MINNKDKEWHRSFAAGYAAANDMARSTKYLLAPAWKQWFHDLTGWRFL